MQSVCLRTRSNFFLLGIFVNQVQESVRNVVGLSLQSQIRFWPVSNMSSAEWIFHGHVYLKWHRCELQTEEWILPVGNIVCVIFRVSVVFDLLVHFHCCPQRRLALAGCDSTAWISRWREAGVWSDSYRHLLGPHLGALLQEVKHSRAPANTPWISSV